MDALKVEGLKHRYGSAPALAGVSLTVAPGEVVAVLGPSGCGKSTLLRAVAGLVEPDGGRIVLGGRVVHDGGRSVVPVERRGVGLVFQDYALFPSLDVAGNVGFGLRGQRSTEVEARVADLLAVAGMVDFARRPVTALSGGQQQRVALVRALASRPSLVLLDEPFANVDAALRASIGQELRRIVRQEGAGALLVTHDRSDALSLADRVAVFAAGPDGGAIVQTDTPEAVYRRPVSAAVAALTGEVWTCAGVGRGDVADTAWGPVPLDGACEGPITVGVRPEDVEVVADPDGDEVVARSFYGAVTRIVVAGPGGQAVAEGPGMPTGRVRVRVRRGVGWR